MQIYANICRYEIYMQNMQKFALPTLLMAVAAATATVTGT